MLRFLGLVILFPATVFDNHAWDLCQDLDGIDEKSSPLHQIFGLMVAETVQTTWMLRLLVPFFIHHLVCWMIMLGDICPAEIEEVRGLSCGALEVEFAAEEDAARELHSQSDL